MKVSIYSSEKQYHGMQLVDSKPTSESRRLHYERQLLCRQCWRNQHGVGITMVSLHWGTFHKIQNTPMSFKDAKGNPVVWKGMNTYPIQLISTNILRSILRQSDIEWLVECRITIEENSFNVSYQPKDIKHLLHKNNGFFLNPPTWKYTRPCHWT